MLFYLLKVSSDLRSIKKTFAQEGIVFIFLSESFWFITWNDEIIIIVESLCLYTPYLHLPSPSYKLISWQTINNSCFRFEVLKLVKISLRFCSFVSRAFFSLLFLQEKSITLKFFRGFLALLMTTWGELRPSISLKIWRANNSWTLMVTRKVFIEKDTGKENLKSITVFSRKFPHILFILCDYFGYQKRGLCRRGN